MAWRVQSLCEGPVVLNDLGLIFTKGSIRDLDVIGREHAEKSNDIKLALQKGWLRELEKSPSPGAPDSANGLGQEVVDQLQATAQKAEEAATQAQKISESQNALIEKLEANNAKLQEQLSQQQQHMQAQGEHAEALVAKSEDILQEVRNFIEKSPLDAKVLAEALKNIQAERALIKGEKEHLMSSGDSEAEISLKTKILDLKDQKLEKNAEQIGKSISGSVEDIDDLLEDMDELGI